MYISSLRLKFVALQICICIRADTVDAFLERPNTTKFQRNGPKPKYKDFKVEWPMNVKTYHYTTKVQNQSGCGESSTICHNCLSSCM